MEGFKQEKIEKSAKKWDQLEEGRHSASAKITSLKGTLSDLESEIEQCAKKISEIDKKNLQISRV